MQGHRTRVEDGCRKATEESEPQASPGKASELFHCTKIILGGATTLKGSCGSCILYVNDNGQVKFPFPVPCFLATSHNDLLANLFCFAADDSHAERCFPAPQCWVLQLNGRSDFPTAALLTSAAPSSTLPEVPNNLDVGERTSCEWPLFNFHSRAKEVFLNSSHQFLGYGLTSC